MQEIEDMFQDQFNTDLPAVQIGDGVDVHYRVVEGDKERIQVFSGTVISIRGSGFGQTFIVRKIASGGIGVERIFPLKSPFISDIKVNRHSFVRRSKLYFLRDRKGKAARLKEKTTAR